MRQSSRDQSREKEMEKQEQNREKQRTIRIMRRMRDCRDGSPELQRAEGWGGGERHGEKMLLPTLKCVAGTETLRTLQSSMGCDMLTGATGNVCPSVNFEGDESFW